MTKWYAILLMMFCMVGAAQAIEMCDDTPQANTVCMMTTPSLECVQYNYTVINTTGGVVSNGNLTLLYEDIYYFNFSKDFGDYVVILCDDTTREIYVEEGEDRDMIIFGLILAPLLLGLILIIAGIGLGEDHAPLKWFIFFLSFVTFFSSLHFGMLGVVHFYDFPALEETIGDTTYWAGIVFFIVLVYFLIYFIKVLVDIAAQKRKDRLQYG